MFPLDRIAFVDLETSGLSPTRDRITEIGVVTLDGFEVNEWTTLINPERRVSATSRFYTGIDTDQLSHAPKFADIGAELFKLLEGRLFVAHNARFDFGFLRAAFERVGMDFNAPVLCSVMLSRKLYPAEPRHDLDSLMRRHKLTAEVRHRALPDAQLLWQFWQVVQSAHAPEVVSTTIDTLLAGPVLPAHLDPALIDRLPDSPGVYALHGEENNILRVGKANNLRLQVINYFRIDKTSAKALAISQQVRDITWRTTSGAIGAHLKLNELSRLTIPARQQRAAKSRYTWRLIPDGSPCLELIELSKTNTDDDNYGVFDSELKAHNALLKVATAHHLCHSLLGISPSDRHPCAGCSIHERTHCGFKTARLKQITKAVIALASLRLKKWPYEGPIGLKERADLHILHEWRYLGTAQSEPEIHQVLETRPDDFDEETFAFLSKTLSRLPARRIVRLNNLFTAPLAPPLYD